jgi:large subunit ribosomal protein L2
LSSIPIGVRISSIELIPNRGAQFVRAAGTYATIITIYKDLCLLKLKSGEIRKFPSNCLATIGVVSNFQYMYRKFKKAGYYRHKGWLPVVRGVAMNPVDHPHGGGQGKTSGGRPSVSPSGFITKGKPTKKYHSRMIVKHRKL